MTKFSIITVVKNNAYGLEKTIESVLRQSFRDFEYIIIGGSSSDETNDVINRYAKSLKKFIIEKDDGIYYAMNKALPFCNGQYYQFLNAGDTLSSNNILEELNTTIECNTEIF